MAVAALRICLCSPSPKLHLQNHPRTFTSHHKTLCFTRYHSKRILKWSRDGIFCLCKHNSTKELQESVEEEVMQRPPFDINLAVVLAGFAFEAYSSPPENLGRREVDPVDCQVVFLSEAFLREVYDGELFVKLKRGADLPAMDPWGTSDPYVVIQLDGQVVKSKVKWATKDPTWNEDFSLNIKIPTVKSLQIAAWDANLVTPHKRMGYAGISLESLCDGNLHEVLVELEGLGGGGRLHLEVKYRSFDEIEEARQWWRIPYISDLLSSNTLSFAFEKVFGTDTVKAQQFVQYAFGKVRSFNYSSENDELSVGKSIKTDGDSYTNLLQDSESKVPRDSINVFDSSEMSLEQSTAEGSVDGLKFKDENTNAGDENNASPDIQVGDSVELNKYFWKNFSDVISSTVVQKFGFPVPEKLKFEGFDLLNNIGLQSKKIAEAGYVEFGLAISESQDVDDVQPEQSSIMKVRESSFSQIRKLSRDVLRQTDSVLGALMVLNTGFSQKNKEECSDGKKETENTDSGYSSGGSVVSTLDEPSMDQGQAEEMKALFSSAESAMEAWAMLATSLGQQSFIKSEFEKICFLDNTSTDTQVAMWRDPVRKRLVIAFRGTEQTRWKDLLTDLMLVPAGLNPERISGDFKEEVQVHSGFLSAYDSVRTRLMSLIKLSTGFEDDGSEIIPKWHIYVTGHSLGGALATLLALELSSSQMAKKDAISVTMYNFGSPRVGNKRFVDIYNEKVTDSWRIVNHRDIIPTVPRLMGYCHVAQPIYLATGDLTNALDNIGLLADGYEGDVIGEYTPDVLVGEFMKGEKQLVEKILQTEINLFRSIRDGSAVMQHMEDFYYISLLEHVRANYQNIGITNLNNERRSS